MRRYVQAFFRHPILLMLPLVLALTVSLGYELRAPRSYQAGMTMWCDLPVPNQSSIFSGTTDMPATSQAAVLTELLQTRDFLARVAKEGPWAGYVASHPGAAADTELFKLAADVAVTTPGPHIMAVATKGATPSDALALAKGVGDAYLADLSDTQRTRAQASVGYYQLQVTDAAKTLADAQSKLQAYLATNQTNGPLGAIADATVTQLTQAVSVAQTNYDQASGLLTNAGVSLASVGDSGVVKVLDTPSTNGLPVSRKKKIILGLVAGIVAGAMVSLFFLLVLVAGDRSVHGAGEIEDLLGMQVVGTVEQFKTKVRAGKGP